MATQAYRSRFDNTVGSNGGTQKIAPGHAPEKHPVAGAENRTPAPVTTVSLALGKDTAWGANDGGPGGNPGGNRYGGASSLAPGKKAAAATVNPQASVDVVLDNILKVGTAHGSGDDWQTRNVSDAPLPAAHGMKARAPGGTVPPTCGASASVPVRKPGA